MRGGRTIDPMLILGRRLEFAADAADGTIEGYARDVPIDLDEPIGSLATRSRRDQYGVLWILIPEDVPTPEPPDEVLRVLAGR